jgi:hypothetical protein
MEGRDREQQDENIWRRGVRADRAGGKPADHDRRDSEERRKETSGGLRGGEKTSGELRRVVKRSVFEIEIRSQRPKGCRAAAVVRS